MKKTVGDLDLVDVLNGHVGMDLVYLYKQDVIISITVETTLMKITVQIDVGLGSGDA